MKMEVLEINILYTSERIAMLLMSFCIPECDKREANLPPPPFINSTWRTSVLAHFPNIIFEIVIGCDA